METYEYKNHLHRNVTIITITLSNNYSISYSKGLEETIAFAIRKIVHNNVTGIIRGKYFITICLSCSGIEQHEYLI